MCKKKETFIGKSVGDNIVGFKSRMNQHISDVTVEREIQHVNSPYMSISGV